MAVRGELKPRGAEPGLVSVVLVNFRGADDTITCIEHLQQLAFPADRVEIICVDNASGDGSAERIRAAVPPTVRIVEADTNTGFTGGCNRGVAVARGEFVAFINNDARPDHRWLAEAVTVLENDSSVGCVASKVLDWEGQDVDFVDAALTWYGMGYKPSAGQPYLGDREAPRDVLFATGSAMVTRRDLFGQVGGFDERFFMFYEDVDFGWRLNLLGHRVRYVPTSVVFHKHHATMKEFGSYREWYLLERNALMTLYKNAGDELLARTLAPAIALSVRRSLATGNADTGILELQRADGNESEESVMVSKQSLTGPYAVDSFVDHLETLHETRKDLQSQRVRSDRELVPLLRNAIEPAIPNARYLSGHQALIDAFEIPELFQSRRRVVVVTGDPLSDKMAGPGIRAFHCAEALSDEHDVRLISTASCTVQNPQFMCAFSSISNIRQHVAWSEVIVFQGFLLEQAPWIMDTDKILVADLYDPMHLEQLEQTRGEEPQARWHNVKATTSALNRQLARGDFFLCASDVQRHFWLGQLAAVGRLNPRVYDSDATLESLVSVVPFGLPDKPPVQTRSAIRGGVPGIGPDDKVVLWAGGIYNWFDPLTLIRAIGELAQRRPEVRLFFLGTQHPNPLVPAMRMVTEARRLSDELGLTGKFVFFNEGWVDYADRQNYLLDADLGVSVHFDHLETTFAFRTRILDYLWAGLPIVVTGGDSFGDLVGTEGLGVRVDERDVVGLATAIEQCLFDDEFAAQCRRNVARVRPRFAWSETLRPLTGFVRDAARAADAAETSDNPIWKAVSTVEASRGRLARNLNYARVRYQEGGFQLVASRGAQKARRVLGRGR